MLLLHGDSQTVSIVRLGNREVWTSGIRTPFRILHTYMDTVILHVYSEEDLPDWDLTGVYVINSGSPFLHETIVARGAYCVHGTFEQGLIRLRHLV